MYLKNIVDEILKGKSRSLSWLAVQMGKTFDGLKLSLVKESLKYKDIEEMSKILEVSPNTFFKSELPTYLSVNGGANSDTVPEQEDKVNIKNCRELVASLKDQIKDKERIISLLNKGN